MLSEHAQADRAEYVRLSRQCEAIKARLERGPATNYELAALSLKYTGRISDLRKVGYDIRVQSQDRASGVTVYHLIPKGQLEMFG